MAVITTSMARLARQMIFHASAGDYFYDGRNTQTPYFQKARREHLETGTVLLFTRDVGHHTCGWFKNPEFERCFHLSISFWDMQGGISRPYEPKLAATWVRAFYGEWTSYVWEESSTLPPQLRRAEVRHYRVLCNPLWQPIIPRGEVYSRELTETGWKSFSELHGDEKGGV